jgi:membrane-bound ClpP family serine protease
MIVAPRICPLVFRRSGRVALLLFVGFLARSGAQAQPAAGETAAEGLFITVPNPLGSVGINSVRARTDGFLDRTDRRGLKLIYDFNPDGAPSRSEDYGVCRDLAEYLLGLTDVTTVAFVHNDVTGHTVLPVLACKEIVMSKRARLGDVVGRQTPNVKEDQRVFYEHVARGRYKPAVVLKMLDKDLEVVEGTLAGSTHYIDRRQEAQEIKKGFVPTGRHDPTLAAGRAGVYDAAQAEKFGLCRLQLETRRDVKDAYGLPTSSLRDPLGDRTANAWRVSVVGRIDSALREKLQRRIKRAVARGANLIFLTLECGEGDAEVGRELADFLRNLRDDKGKEPVKTVAVVTDRTRNTAVFLALGCTEIVMDQRGNLGDRFDTYLQKRPQYGPAISKSLEELAELQGYPALLARAMLDPAVAVHLVSRKGKPFERRLVDGNELNEDRRGEQKWEGVGWLKPPGEWLRLGAADAKKLDVAKFVYEGDARGLTPWLRFRYGLDDKQPHDVSSDWLEDLAEFLCSPVVSVFLVMIGIAGLILELKVPGVGLPGVVAAVCFVLYFWAHSHLAGHLTMLAVLLFLLGLVLIGLELFLVPGLGITGISGIVLVLVSLALATLVKKPETQYEWMEFGATLTTLSLSLLGAVAGAFALAYYLPHIPGANRLVLAPPADPADVLEEGPAPAAAYSNLLGAIGEAATTLRPAGKARFGDDFVDVVAEGSYVATGSRVQVIEIEGNRVVVKEV